MQPTGNASALPNDHARDDAWYQFAGLLIVALFPALFWTAVAAVIGAVATFCGVVAQSLFSRS